MGLDSWQQHTHNLDSCSTWLWDQVWRSLFQCSCLL